MGFFFSLNSQPASEGSQSMTQAGYFCIPLLCHRNGSLVATEQAAASHLKV